VDDAQRVAVREQLVDAGDLEPAGGRAGQVPLGAGRAAVGDPHVQLDAVAAQDAQPEPVVDELDEAERLLEEAHGGPLVGDGQGGDGGQEADGHARILRLSGPLRARSLLVSVRADGRRVQDVGTRVPGSGLASAHRPPSLCHQSRHCRHGRPPSPSTAGSGSTCRRTRTLDRTSRSRVCALRSTRGGDPVSSNP
jgi:hypothetical protein